MSVYAVDRWYAVRVKTRDEQVVAQQLRMRGNEVFLPTAMERRRWSDRVKTVCTALFPGYVFCRFDYVKRTLIQMVPGVLDVVSFSAEGTPVDDEEIASLQILTNSSRRLCACTYVRAGEKVIITDGPLRGAVGVFEGSDSTGSRLVVSVTLLARALRVELDPLDVSAIRPYTLPAALLLGSSAFRETAPTV